jgi:hypothetical protein
MSNLTFDEQLIFKHEAEPLEGHTVVVLERVGKSGERFHSLLLPDDEPPRRPFRSLFGGKPDPFLAFAVDASKSRTLKFSEHVDMSERPHDLTLHFILEYRVSDSKLLVTCHRSDPLGAVRDQVAAVVADEVGELSWSNVWHSFRVARQPVVDRTLTELKIFARDRGISIIGVRLKADIPHEVEMLRQRMAAIGDAVTKELVGVVHGTSDWRDLGDRANIVGSGVPRSGIHAAGSPNGSFTPAVGAGHALGSLAAGGDGLSGVLGDLLTLTEPITPPITRNGLLGSLLHLVAAMVVDDSTQDTTEQVRFASEARAAIADVSGIPADRHDALRHLANPNVLRERLGASFV